MRASVRRLVAFPMIVGLLACTQAVDEQDEGSEEETESTAQAVAITSTPGKAVWTKVWRWPTEGLRPRAVDVATDETGATFLARVNNGDNVNGYPDSADVTRYTATGAMSYRVSLEGHDLIDRLHVAARGGRLVTTADRGASGIVTVFDAASGNVVRRFTLASAGPPGTTGRVFLKDVAVDDDGGFVVVAAALGTVDWGTGPMEDENTNNNTDAIVARFSSNGQLIAARRFESAYVGVVGLDGSGNIYVGSKGHLTAPYTQTHWGVSKLTRSLLISDSFFLEGDATITAMDVSRGGRVTFGGTFGGDLRVGPNVTLHESNVGADYGDPFAVKLDTDMNPAYARSFESSARTTVGGIGIDSYGQVVVAMNFTGNLTIDGTTYSAPGEDERLAVVKLGAVGFAPRWTKVYGATGTSAARNHMNAVELTIADSDRIVMVGDFRTDIDLGRGMIDGSERGNSYLARLYQ